MLFLVHYMPPYQISFKLYGKCRMQKCKVFAIGPLWLVGLVGKNMAVATLNSFYVVFGPLLAPIPNFIQIGWKAQKLKIFAIGRFWLVGLVGQKMVVGISNSFYVVSASLLAPIPNFIQIRWKIRFWLVGLVGRKMISIWRVTNDLCRLYQIWTKSDENWPS